MEANEIQKKQEQWTQEIKNLMVEIQLMQTDIRNKRKRMQFLNGAIAAGNEFIQQDNEVKTPEWAIPSVEKYFEGWERSWGEISKCMNRAMRRAAKRLARANGQAKGSHEQASNGSET